jgi:hypothetical protein
MYWVWSALLFLYGLAKFTDGRFAELAGESFEWFLAVYLAIQMVLIGIGGILCWLADARARKWASWFFIAYCAWRAMDSFWGAIRFSGDSFELDWLRLIVFPFGWFVLATVEWLKRHKRGSNLELGSDKGSASQ